MNYPLLALLGLVVAVAGFAALTAVGFRRNRRMSGSRYFSAIAITTVVLVALTAAFDNFMIAAELFHYAPESLLGISVGRAPIEDFSYPIAGALFLPALWIALADGSNQWRKDFAQLFLTSRPISWINTAFPFGAAYLLTAREIDAVLVLGVLYFLVPYNVAMYGINDVFDYASDLANPRKGGIEGALLPRRLHRTTLRVAALTNIPFLLLLAAFGGPASWTALALSAFAVVAYSAPGLRFKERPFLDSVTSSIHFVSPAVIGLLLAGAHIDGSLVLLLTAFFFWGMAAHAFGAVQDIVPDREAGIRSIATAIGARATVRAALTLWVTAGLLMLGTDWPGPLGALLALPYVFICAPFWFVTDENSGTTNRAWRRFIALNYLCGFLATLLLIFAATHK
ncbi:hypothetical protein GCM10010401_21080 [Rarobacter faecitabidus]|uniref:Lycopene cyclase domain-containing protein n=1 Tax=Rarobacter faecitabidus TaxID=13243 RepID=A0A542ZVG2_RARFA|nr:prenyltransferase [Rarobacter faecitabidus]TQL64311.1 lycopene cyclase domain-containing protein [Rarobacter faecitabidus]